MITSLLAGETAFTGELLRDRSTLMRAGQLTTEAAPLHLGQRLQDSRTIRDGLAFTPPTAPDLTRHHIERCANVHLYDQWDQTPRRGRKFIEGLAPVTETNPAEVRTQLGRNLTYGMLDALGRSIVIGSYDKRVFPTEAELARQHGVSRSVTREAVKMLTAKGLLSARPRQGTIIQPSTSWNLFDTDVLRWLLERKFSVDLLKHFNQLRVAIEPEAAALAAAYADAAERRAISAGLARMEAAENEQDNTLDADIAFHVAILKGSKNPFFAQFQDVVSTALRSSIQFTNRIKGRSASVAAHAAVRDAIMKKSPEKARIAMKRIITDVLELIDKADSQQKKAR